MSGGVICGINCLVTTESKTCVFLGGKLPFEEGTLTATLGYLYFGLKSARGACCDLINERCRLFSALKKERQPFHKGMRAHLSHRTGLLYLM